MHASTVQNKATTVARIFNVLAGITLVVGALAAVAMLLIGVSNSEFGVGLLSAIVVAAVTAVSCASITLYTVAAGYVSVRLGDTATTHPAPQVF